MGGSGEDWSISSKMLASKVLAIGLLLGGVVFRYNSLYQIIVWLFPGQTSCGLPCSVELQPGHHDRPSLRKPLQGRSSSKKTRTPDEADTSSPRLVQGEKW